MTGWVAQHIHDLADEPIQMLMAVTVSPFASSFAASSMREAPTALTSNFGVGNAAQTRRLCGGRVARHETDPEGQYAQVAMVMPVSITELP